MQRRAAEDDVARRPLFSEEVDVDGRVRPRAAQLARERADRVPM